VRFLFLWGYEKEQTHLSQPQGVPIMAFATNQTTTPVLPAQAPWTKLDEQLKLKHSRLSEGDLSNFETVQRYQRKVPGGWLLSSAGKPDVFVTDLC